MDPEKLFDSSYSEHLGNSLDEKIIIILIQCFKILIPEILDQVKKCCVPRFRPKVPEELGHPDYQDMMTQCWEEIPTSRPRFDDVMKALKKLNGGK